MRITINGKRHLVGRYETLQLAKAALERAKADKVHGTYVPNVQRRQIAEETRRKEIEQGITLREWVDVWIEQLEGAGKTVGTLKTYRSTLEVHVLPELGDRALREITKTDIDQLIERLKALPAKRGTRGESNGVWQNVARTISSCFTAAAKQGAGGIEVSPVHIEGMSKRKRKQITDHDDVATDHEVAKIANAMPGIYALAIYLGAYCAMRMGEVLGLQRRDFESLDRPELAMLNIRRQHNTKSYEYTAPKYGSVRRISIPSSIVPLIVEHLEKSVDKTASAPVFPNKPGGSNPASPSAFDRSWRNAPDQVRPGLRFHDLRHTGLTMYGQKGATVSELMERAGHTDPATVMRYQHATVERDRLTTTKLNANIVLPETVGEIASLDQKRTANE